MTFDAGLRGPRLLVRLERARARRLVLALGLVNLVMLAGTWLHNGLGAPDPYPVGFLLRQLELRSEGALAPFYSSTLSLLVSAAALVCFVVEGGRRRERFRVAWWAVFLLFAGLSLDEVGLLHERIGRVPGLNPFEGMLVEWVGVLALPALGVVLLLGAFLFDRLRRSRRALLLAGLGLLLLASVFVQEQVEAMIRTRMGYRPILLALAEEGSELFGMLALFAGLLDYLFVAGPTEGSGRTAVLRLEVRASRRRVWAVTGGGLAALAVAMAGVGWLTGFLPEMPRFEELLEVLPAAWFPAVLGLWSVGLATFLLPRVRHGSLRYGALAAFALLLAADLGSGLAFSEQLWADSPRMRRALDVALAAICAIPVLALWPDLDGGWRAVPAAASVVLAAAYAWGPRGTIPLVFAGLALVVVALTRRMLEARAGRAPG